MVREIALVVHVFGVLLWVGGTATAAWTAASLVSDGETKALSSVRKALLMLGAPGILLAFAGGLGMLVPDWSHYAHAGWMHGKLTIGLVLAALHGVLIGRVRRAAAGTKPATASFFAGVAIAYVALGLTAIALVMLRPGG